jgi:transcriptional regulator with GAF, ATPase, and Fis domain
MIKTKDEVRSFELGVDDFIIKPFDLTALIKRIKAIIRKTEKIKILKDEARMFEIAKAISSLMNTDELLQRVLEYAVEISKSDGGTIMIYDTKTDEFEIKTSYGDFKESVVGKHIKSGERVIGAAAKGRKPIIINGDLKDSPQFRQLKQYNGVISGMVIPMLVREKVIECITLKRTKGNKIFSQHESYLLSIFASQAAMYVENASLYEQLEKQIKK